MYQGGSDNFLGPMDPIYLKDEGWGLDFEAELAVIVDDVPLGVSDEEAAEHIKFLMLLNDISLRNLIPSELEKGFGFVHGKPPTSFSPVAVTVNSLGEYWRDGKLNLPLLVHFNKKKVGWVNAEIDMTFDFSRLVSHAAKTRPLGAGTIIGSGTVSNADQQHGYSCIAEMRMIEIIKNGEATTPFMKFEDRIKLDVQDNKGQSIFGVIDQIVKPYRTN
jgi:fumarylacetoacetate (FAA) hydrolase